MSANATPTSYAKSILYIKDDSTVAAHVNREFGTRHTKEFIARLRAKMPPKVAPGPQNWIAAEPYQGDKYRRQENAIKAASAQLAQSIKAAHG